MSSSSYAERISAVVETSERAWRVTIDPATGLGNVSKRDGRVWVWTSACSVTEDGRLEGPAELGDEVWLALRDALRQATQYVEHAPCCLCGRDLPLVEDSKDEDVCIPTPQAGGKPACERCRLQKGWL